MNKIEELAEVIKPAAAHDYWPQEAARLVIEAGYVKQRKVTSLVEVDALSYGAIVMVARGDSPVFVMEKFSDGWYSTASESEFTPNASWLGGIIVNEGIGQCRE